MRGWPRSTPASTRCGRHDCGCGSGNTALGRLSIAVSDAGRPARRKLVQLGTHGRAPPIVTADARGIVSGIVTDLYGSKAARWFLKAYGEALLAHARFEPRVGINVCAPVPAEVLDG